MAHAKQEERRPGIKKIFSELQEAYPKKSTSEIATLSKIEWGKRHGFGAASTAVQMEALKGSLLKPSARVA